MEVTSIDNTTRPRSVRLRLASLLILFGFLASLAFHYVQASYFGGIWPKSTYLYSPGAQFMDFGEVYNQTHDLNPYSGARLSCPHCSISSYYPFGLVLIYLFTWMSHDLALISYLGLLIVILASFAKTWLKMPVPAESWLTGLIILGLNYPVQFLIDRGNFEGLVFAALVAFAWLYTRANAKLSALALGAAIAQKGFPAVFLLVYLARRQFRPLILAVVSSVGLTLISLLVIRGSPIDNLGHLQFAQHAVGALTTEPRGSIHAFKFVRYSTSLFALIKLITLELFPHLGFHQDRLTLILSRYTLAVVIAAIAIFVYVASIRRKFELWELLLIAASVGQLFPNVSYDYKLVHFLIPFALFLNSDAPRNQSLSNFYLGAFSLLFVPKGYYLIEGDVPIDVVINTLVICVMLVAALVWGGAAGEASETAATLVGAPASVQ